MPYLKQAEAAEANALMMEMFPAPVSREQELEFHEAARAERRRRGIEFGFPTYKKEEKKKGVQRSRRSKR
jgi:hypothetical protein